MKANGSMRPTCQLKSVSGKSGYNIIKFNVDKRARGPDIIGEKDNQRIIVEVKGYQSDKFQVILSYF